MGRQLGTECGAEDLPNRHPASSRLRSQPTPWRSRSTGPTCWVANAGVQQGAETAASSMAPVLGTYPVARSFLPRWRSDGVNLWVTGASANKVTKLTATGVIGGGLNPAQVATLPLVRRGPRQPDPSGRRRHRRASRSTAPASGSPTPQRRASPRSTRRRTPLSAPTRSSPVRTPLASDGTYMWVTDRTANKVTKLKAATGAVVGSSHGRPFPRWCRVRRHERAGREQQTREQSPG